MATVVNVQKNDLFGKIGNALGAVSGQGLVRGQQQKVLSTQRQAFEQLQRDVAEAPSDAEAFALSRDPKYSFLFTDPDDVNEFIDMAKDLRGSKNQDFNATTLFNSEGEELQIDLTDEQLAQAMQGVPVSQILPGLAERTPNIDDFGVVKPKTETKTTREEFFQPEKDEEGNLVSAGFFVKGEQPEGLVSAENIRLNQASDRAARAAKDATKDDATDAQRRARGLLREHEIEPTSQNLDKALLIESERSQISTRVARAFGIDPLNIGESFGSVRGKRFQAATSIYEQLRLDGLKSSGAKGALNAAMNLARVMFPDSDEKGGRVKVEERAVSELTKADIGRVLRAPSGTLYVFAGFTKDGKKNVVKAQ